MREQSAPDEIDRVAKLSVRLVEIFGQIPAPFPRLDFSRREAEEKEVVFADRVANLDVGAVERADRERAVHRKLHVAGAGRLFAGGGDLLRQISRRVDEVAGLDVEVRQE